MITAQIVFYVWPFPFHFVAFVLKLWFAHKKSDDGKRLRNNNKTKKIAHPKINIYICRIYTYIRTDTHIHMTLHGTGKWSIGSTNGKLEKQICAAIASYYNTLTHSFLHLLTNWVNLKEISKWWYRLFAAHVYLSLIPIGSAHADEI